MHGRRKAMVVLLLALGSAGTGTAESLRSHFSVSASQLARWSLA